MNYLYIDTNGRKQGPVNDQQLKVLAMRGIIIPDTPLATDTGHKGLAGQIPGLFDTMPPQPSVGADTYGLNLSVPPPVKPNPFAVSVKEKAMDREVERRVSDVLRTRDSKGSIIAIIITLFIVVGIGVFLWRNSPKVDLLHLQNVKKRNVVVSLSAIENMPLHGATYEIWVNGEKIDSKDSTDGFFSTTVQVPTGYIDIEGRVKYKNGYGAVMDEKRTKASVKIPEIGETKIIKLEV